MPKLVLKFESATMKEVPLGTRPVTIGRAPDNDIPIDNLAVSNYHSRVYVEAGSLVLEDLNSLNGTFLNDIRIERAMIRHGDTILIGKHQVVVDQEHDAALPLDGWRKAPVPRVNETMVLDTQERRKMLEQAAAAGERSQLSPDRLRVPTLTVLRGRTNQKEYRISGKLTVIGHSKMATIRLRGWFTPQIAAQINKHEDGYYLGRGDQLPKINGARIEGLTKLNDGDLIEVGRVQLNFVFRD
ncbi:MAG TPA: FHA domain-containing protein [Candidatus Dormibacteraeota bacterium]|nr:FHA domain-containing protein [Candidatus Dormibacteraeota bacterium]